MVDRIVRAIRLDWTVFREIAVDPEATKQAAIIVLVVSFLSAVGSGLDLLVDKAGLGTAALGFFSEWLISGVIIGWIGWSILTYLIGTMLFEGDSSIEEMLRVLGYASAPRLLGLLGFVPCIGGLFGLTGWILSLIAGVIAVREGMEFDTGKAVVTVLISWIVALAIYLIVRSIFGVGSWFLPIV